GAGLCYTAQADLELVTQLTLASYLLVSSSRHPYWSDKPVPWAFASPPLHIPAGSAGSVRGESTVPLTAVPA
ncbi:mCG1027945, partial [Mus musculus]